MSLEHSPGREGTRVASIGHNQIPASINDPDYWHALITEREAAAFLSLTDRTLQKWRQEGGGPRYVRLSASCIRYTRLGLKQHADERVRQSTSDPGSVAA